MKKTTKTETPRTRARQGTRGKPLTTRPTPNEPLATAPVTDGALTHQHIAEAAYYIFLERGGQHGFELEDWITAERRLRARG
jgi:hypothetical protein